MWKSRKFILLVVLAVVILVGSIAGVVYAQEDEDEPEDVAPRVTLLERVAEKLGIDEQQLKDAFAEIMDEMQAEIHLQWLDKAVEEGLITENEAEAYNEWWSARPDVDFGLGGFGLHRSLGFGGPRIRSGCGFGFRFLQDTK